MTRNSRHGAYLLAIPVLLSGACGRPVERITPDKLTTQPVLLTKAQVLDRIAQLPPWPSEFATPMMSDETWLMLVRIAQELQSVDEATLSAAMVEYCDRYPVGCREWSRIVVLLPVMFAIPSRPAIPTDPDLWRGGKFGSVYDLDTISQEDMENRERLLTYPVWWHDGQPDLVGPSGSYNGPPYSAKLAWAAYHQNYPFRDLKPVIKLLEKRILPIQKLVPKETNTKPIKEHEQTNNPR